MRNLDTYIQTWVRDVDSVAKERRTVESERRVGIKSRFDVEARCT